MQVGNYRRQQTVGAAFLAAAQGNPFGAARTAYQVGKSLYRAMPKRKGPSQASNKSRKRRTKKTSKAPGGAGSLRQRKPYSRKVAYRKARKCRTMGRRKLSKKVCRMEASIKSLKFAENASLGTFTHRKIENQGSVTTLATGQDQGTLALFGHVMSDFNESIQYLQYYDPSTPGTLIVADGKTGTYDRRFLFKSVFCSVVLRNNYQTDCNVRVYLCTPKQSSSIAPLTAWRNGIAANPDTTITSDRTLGQYPNDYSDFKDVWTAKLHCKASLSAGQTMTCSHGIKDVEFDPTAFATHTASFQQKYKNFAFIIVVNGTVAHTATTTGLAQCGVDVMLKTTRVIQYDAGVNISFQRVDNTLGDQTTGSVQSLKPTADNLPFSST